MTWAFKQIKPQKARGKFTESLWTDPDWVAEEKYDGDRRIAQFCGTTVRFTGTRESVDGSGYVEKTENLPHLHTMLKGTLDGTVLDGEIVHPHPGKGGGSKFVTAIMGSHPERAFELQEKSGWLIYRVFDCLYYKGRDVRDLVFYARRQLVTKALHLWSNKYAQSTDFSAARKSFYEEVVARGGEGVILKHKDHTYGDEKLWVKVKHEATADVVVMGFKPGKGKNAGMVGSIEFGQYRTVMGAKGLARMGFARGFGDALMALMTNRPQDFMGKVVRVTHNGREPTGAFRHPRFDCWRPDKSPKDCIYDPEEK